MLSLSPWSIKLLRFDNWNFPRVKKKLLQNVNITFYMFHFSFHFDACTGTCILFGRVAFVSVNNSPRPNVFPVGVANFGKAMYRSLERSTQDIQDGFFLYSAQASFSWPRADLARLLRRAYSPPFWITSFEYVKVCGICFSIWESLIGFYISCYPITTILACIFSIGVRISWKKLC